MVGTAHHTTGLAAIVIKVGSARNPSSIYPQITQINAEYLCNLRINDLKNFLFFITAFQE